MSAERKRAVREARTTTATRVWWRCGWCSAGGSVQVEHAKDAPELDVLFATKKAVEHAHERSGWCHVARHLLHVDTSTAGAIPK